MAANVCHSESIGIYTLTLANNKKATSLKLSIEKLLFYLFLAKEKA
jgi:hypothetical protein